MFVRRVAALRDDALPSFGARALPGLRIVQRSSRAASGSCSGSAQQRATLVERQAGHVAAIEPQDVEDVSSPPGRARPTPGGFAVEDRRRGPAGWRSPRRPIGCELLSGNRFRDNKRTSEPFLNASNRMPSNLRSKIHSGPVNRSCVSVAAIGSSQSGNPVITISTRPEPQIDTRATDDTDNTDRFYGIGSSLEAISKDLSQELLTAEVAESAEKDLLLCVLVALRGERLFGVSTPSCMARLILAVMLSAHPCYPCCPCCPCHPSHRVVRGTKPSTSRGPARETSSPHLASPAGTRRR